MMTETIRNAVRVAGWQVSPNNIFSQPGVELMSAGPGSLQPVFGQSVRVIDDIFVIVQTTPQPRLGTIFLDFIHTEIARFPTVEETMAWLRVNGTVSEGGQGFSPTTNVWD